MRGHLRGASARYRGALVAFVIGAFVFAAVLSWEVPWALPGGPLVPGVLPPAPDLGERFGFFTENVGQVSNMAVRYYGSSNGLQVGFAESAVLIRTFETLPAPADLQDSLSGAGGVSDEATARSALVRVSFPGANAVLPEGRGELPFRSHFFLSNDPAHWRTNVRNYREVLYRDLYDGIDLEYRGTTSGPKYEFVVRPGAKPEAISLSFAGADGLEILPNGNLVAKTAIGELHDAAPQAFEAAQEVRCDFVRRDSFSVGFLCPGWGGTSPLRIDPIVFATFLGGGGAESVSSDSSMVVDASGSVYVLGDTTSVDFPATPGAYDDSCAPSCLNSYSDLFVAKLSPDGSNLVYATYVGGDERDFGRTIAVDRDGNAYVAGMTYSIDFPTTPFALDRTFNGWEDVFVVKLNPTGSSLVYATFLGGMDGDRARSLALDGSGHAYVSGTTWSKDFPTTAGVLDRTFNGGSDSFIAEFDSDGSSLVYSTFLGGSGDEGACCIFVAASEAYLAGATTSRDFPVTPGAFDRTHDGCNDPFVTCNDLFLARVGFGGTSLELSTFIGGRNTDYAWGLTVDPAGDFFVTGQTYSTDFPTTPGAFDQSLNDGSEDGFFDAFAVKLESSGSRLAYSTFLGGVREDIGYSIDVAPTREAYITGHTRSSDFPLTSRAFDSSLDGGMDAFVAILGASGGGLAFSTLIGGAGQDRGYSIAVGGDGFPYVAGYTDSSDFPVSPGAFDTLLDGSTDVFVAKVSLEETSSNTPPTITSFWASPAAEGEPVAFTVNASDAEGDSLTYAFDFGSNGVFDIAGPNSKASHMYGDDFNGNATIMVSDGTHAVEAFVPVHVANSPPVLDSLVISATGNATIALRVAGEKFHDVTATLYRNGVSVANATVVRTPGNPDAQTASLGRIEKSNDTYSVTVSYTPSDDPVIGQPDGATPAWIVLNQSGAETWLHHTFNARHPDTWAWRIDNLGAYVKPAHVAFALRVTDPGSDDLTVTWQFGDATTETQTFLNDPAMGSDPYPSPDVHPRSVLATVDHTYASPGNYTVTLTVRDDDGGVVTISFTIGP